MNVQSVRLKLLLSLCAILGFAAVVHSASITVPSKGVKTISKGILQASPGDTIWVEPGVYREQITTKSGTVLISKELFKAVIDGKGRGNVVTLTNNSAITGLDIRNGTAGVFSRSVGGAIRKCRIYRNRGSGVICAGSLPVIEDNVIVFNEASGIQVLDISSGAPTISHNTIAYNANHGIAVNGASTLTIENNIIAFNGGIGAHTETQTESDVTMSYNLIYDNHGKIFITTEETFSFDPLFKAPKRKAMDFSLLKDSPAIKRSKGNDDLGARLRGN
jgi:parallel beta-helix repeat protein